MRTEWLRLVGAVAWIFAVALIASERRLIRRLRAANAVSPDTATTIPSSRSPLAQFRASRLQLRGAIGATPEGRLFLDPAGYARYRRSRRQRALVMIGIGVPLTVCLWWLGAFD